MGEDGGGCWADAVKISAMCITHNNVYAQRDVMKLLLQMNLCFDDSK